MDVVARNGRQNGPLRVHRVLSEQRVEDLLGLPRGVLAVLFRVRVDARRDVVMRDVQPRSDELGHGEDRAGILVEIRGQEPPHRGVGGGCVDVAAPQHVAQQRAARDERRGLRVVHHDQVGLDRLVRRIGFQRAEVGVEQVCERQRLVHALQRVVELLGDLEERVVPADGQPARVHAQRARQRKNAAQHFGHPAADEGGIDVRPAPALDRRGAALQRFDPLAADVRLVVGNRQGGVRPILGQPRMSVRHVGH